MDRRVDFEDPMIDHFWAGWRVNVVLGNNVGAVSGEEAMGRKEVEVIEIKGGRGILYF